MTEIEAQRLVRVLVTAYPNTFARFDEKQRDQTMALYRRMLEDLDVAASTAAVQRLIASSKWMPTIAEIRSAVVEATTGGTRPGAQAWGDVMAAVGKFGRERTPQFTDPIVAHVVAAMGWRQICDSENAVADRAHFIRAYEQFAERLRYERQMPEAVRQALPENRVAQAMTVGAVIAALPTRSFGGDLTAGDGTDCTADVEQEGA